MYVLLQESDFMYDDDNGGDSDYGSRKSRKSKTNTPKTSSAPAEPIPPPPVPAAENTGKHFTLST